MDAPRGYIGATATARFVAMRLSLFVYRLDFAALVCHAHWGNNGRTWGMMGDWYAMHTGGMMGADALGVGFGGGFGMCHCDALGLAIGLFCT
jgi:hypothetical protein